MILVTGGTGFIGSHACVALARAGHELLILDNLRNSRADVVERLAAICGRRLEFVEGDVRDAALLDEIFHRHSIAAVMHFAGLKAVGESVAKPLEYYDNNVHGTLQLLAAMRRASVRTPLFFRRLQRCMATRPACRYVNISYARQPTSTAAAS